MRTLLASSGSTLGHGPTTRTHAFRRPPKRERGRPRLTHTHTQYTLFDECIAPGPTQWLHPLSPVSHRLASASLAVSEPTPSPPSPTPPPLPPNQLAQAARVSRRPQYPPPEWREYGRHGACLAHTKLSLPFPPRHPLPPHQHCLVSAAAAIVFSVSLWPSPPPPLIGAF